MPTMTRPPRTHPTHAALALIAASLAASSSVAQTVPAVERARAALAAVDLATCEVEAPPAANTVFHVAVAVFPDGTWAPAVVSPSAPAGAADALRACVVRGLAARLTPTLPRPPRSTALVERTWHLASRPVLPDPVEPEGQREAHDGSPGAVCRWGQRRPDFLRLPTPVPCRAGLTCCTAGGAAGSDSTCHRVPAGRCPAYP